MVLNFCLEPLKLPVETISEWVHLFLFIVDVYQSSSAINLELGVELMELEFLDAIRVELENLSRLLFKIRELESQCLGASIWWLVSWGFWREKFIHRVNKLLNFFEMSYFWVAILWDPLEFPKRGFELRIVTEKQLLESLELHHIDSLKNWIWRSTLLLHQRFKVEIVSNLIIEQIWADSDGLSLLKLFVLSNIKLYYRWVKSGPEYLHILKISLILHRLIE